LIVPIITKPLHVNTGDLTCEPKLVGLKLVHPPSDSSDLFDVTLLIGVDFYYDLMEDELIRTDSGVVALKSKLG